MRWWNDVILRNVFIQQRIVFRRKTVGAYRIRPEVGENETNHQPNQSHVDKKMLLHFKTWPEQADVYDPFHPGAREIYWDNLSKHIFSLGMDAW